MQRFTQIDDANAIIRVKNGVLKQVNLFQRSGHVYVGALGGYVRITAKFGETYGTVVPTLKVVELEGAGIELSGIDAPVYRAPRAQAA